MDGGLWGLNHCGGFKDKKHLKKFIKENQPYYKKHIPEFRVFENFSGKEDLLDEQKFQEYIQRPAYIVQGQIITDLAQAQALVQQLQLQREAARMQSQLNMRDQMTQQGLESDAIIPEPDLPPIQFEQVTFNDLIQNKAIEVVQVLSCKVHQCVVIGDKLLYKRILPIEHYPIVPFINIHTRTPYPVSDVRLVKGMQEYINKTRSLIIAHATTSTNTKILVPEGSVDMSDFEQKWAQPGVAISYDPTDGAPMAVQPSPLPNELYQNEMTAKNDIDHQLGIYEMMQGNTAAAPQTYKATISLDEFGQRKTW